MKTDGEKITMAILLEKITADNFLDAFHLKLKREQKKYVSHPIRSLAQAYVYRDQCQPFGIYCDACMVGYVMVIYDDTTLQYAIWHMMIDRSQQGRGFGKAALRLVLEYIKKKPFGDSDSVVLTCNKKNDHALGLYRALGFVLTGNEDEDEVELSLSI